MEPREARKALDERIAASDDPAEIRRLRALKAAAKLLEDPKKNETAAASEYVDGVKDMPAGGPGSGESSIEIDAGEFGEQLGGSETIKLTATSGKGGKVTIKIAPDSVPLAVEIGVIVVGGRLMVDLSRLPDFALPAVGIDFTKLKQRIRKWVEGFNDERATGSDADETSQSLRPMPDTMAGWEADVATMLRANPRATAADIRAAYGGPADGVWDPADDSLSPELEEVLRHEGVPGALPPPEQTAGVGLTPVHPASIPAEVRDLPWIDIESGPAFYTTQTSLPRSATGTDAPPDAGVDERDESTPELDDPVGSRVYLMYSRTSAFGMSGRSWSALFLDESDGTSELLEVPDAAIRQIGGVDVIATAGLRTWIEGLGWTVPDLDAAHLVPVMVPVPLSPTGREQVGAIVFTDEEFNAEGRTVGSALVLDLFRPRDESDRTTVPANTTSEPPAAPSDSGSWIGFVPNWVVGVGVALVLVIVIGGVVVFSGGGSDDDGASTSNTELDGQGDADAADDEPDDESADAEPAATDPPPGDTEEATSDQSSNTEPPPEPPNTAEGPTDSDDAAASDDASDGDEAADPSDADQDADRASGEDPVGAVDQGAHPIFAEEEVRAAIAAASEVDPPDGWTYPQDGVTGVVDPSVELTDYFRMPVSMSETALMSIEEAGFCGAHGDFTVVCATGSTAPTEGDFYLFSMTFEADVGADGLDAIYGVGFAGDGPGFSPGSADIYADVSLWYNVSRNDGEDWAFWADGFVDGIPGVPRPTSGFFVISDNIVDLLVPVSEVNRSPAEGRGFGFAGPADGGPAPGPGVAGGDVTGRDTMPLITIDGDPLIVDQLSAALPAPGTTDSRAGPPLSQTEYVELLAVDSVADYNVALQTGDPEQAREAILFDFGLEGEAATACAESFDESIGLAESLEIDPSTLQLVPEFPFATYSAAGSIIFENGPAGYTLFLAPGPGGAFRLITAECLPQS